MRNTAGTHTMALDVTSTNLDGVLLLTPQRFGDDRGYFSETYNQRVFNEAGVTARFIQDNQSLSVETFTLRGLHYQTPPFAQAKLVRVLSGAVLDVAVDARKGSKTYGQHIKAKLTAAKGEQLFVPPGFLHGFLTLEPETIVAYKVDNYYDRKSDGVVAWNDAALGIDWGVEENKIKLSDKDRNAPSFEDFQSPF